MRIPRFLAVLWLSLLLAPARASDPSDPGPLRVESFMAEWRDAARKDREVPVRFYVPEGTNAAPLVVFSHGLGGTRDGYEYFGRHLASHGFISLHPQHRGSDSEVILGAKERNESPLAAMRRAAVDPTNAINRPLDVSFAIDRALAASKAEGPLKGRVDAARIGVAGHSFGAWTALAVAGQGSQRTARLKDPRVRAAIAMSPPANRVDAAMFSGISIPVLLMTGTLDESPIGNSTAADRRKIFPLLTGAEAFLLVLNGGDHMVFSGRGRTASSLPIPGWQGDPAKDAGFQACIKATSLAFLDAFLRNDAAAKRWLLSETGARALIGARGTWEHHPAPEKP